MEPIEFDIELWANPPPEKERMPILIFWTHLAELGLDGSEAIQRQPLVSRWNTAVELYEIFSENVDCLSRLSDKPWIPAGVVSRADGLLELMSALADRNGDRFWTNEALESDASWAEIRRDAQRVAEEIRPWVEAVGVTIDPTDTTKAEIDHMR